MNYYKYHKYLQKCNQLLSQNMKGGKVESTDSSIDSNISLSSVDSVDSIDVDSISIDGDHVDLDIDANINNTKEKCEENINIYKNQHINDTTFPFITTQKQIDKYLKLSLVISPNTNKYAEQYNSEKYKSIVYKNLDTNCIAHTIQYIFDKMKTGVFVRIYNNILVNFIPIYNTNYRNDFGNKLKFKENNVKQFLENKKKYNKYQSKINYDVNKWNATNCLLRNEFDDRSPTLAYLSEMYDLLVQTLHNRKVNDSIFFINRKDFPYLSNNYNESYEHIYGEDVKMADKWTKKSFIPILSQSTTNKHADIPIPTGDDWSLITQQWFKSSTTKCKNDYLLDPKIINNLPKWSDRKSIVFWRGMSTGCGNTTDTNPRLKITQLSKELEDKGINYLDAGVVKFTNRDKKTIYNDHVEYFTNDENLKTKNYVDRFEQLNYKFILNIEGNSAAYRFGSLFKLGFCVLNVESKYKLWFEQFLIEDVHYIKIKHDLSDCIEKIEWCLNNDDKCEQIAKAGVEFYNTYFNHEFVFDYMSDTLNKISSMYTKYDREFDLVDWSVIKQYHEQYKKNNMLKLEKIKLNTKSKTDNMLIIVPYRDNKFQDREKQLKKFIEYYSKYNILIIEQNDDDKKFNRGYLLNIGFDFATKSLKYSNITCVVFHDVDLIVDYNIVDTYYGNTDYPIIHLGRLIKDYYSDTFVNFLGGVIKFNNDVFSKINGFPNNFYVLMVSVDFE